MTLDVTITLPASLAAAAHQLGEDASFVAYGTARALDSRGSGRVWLDDLADALTDVFSARQVRRIIGAQNRYFEVEGRRARLSGQQVIIEGLPEGLDLFFSRHSRSFPLRLLDSRPRRGAALVAAALAGVDNPRSNAFLSRFVGVDRKTIAVWLRDPVIRDQILDKVPSWVRP